MQKTEDLNPLQVLHYIIIDEMKKCILNVELINKNLSNILQSLGYDEEVRHGLICDRIKVILHLYQQMTMTRYRAFQFLLLS